MLALYGFELEPAVRGWLDGLSDSGLAEQDHPDMPD